MSSFNQPRQCNKECGSIIYFDRNSLVGHPKENIWLPLEYREGRKTDTLHNCPKKNGNATLNGNPTPAAAKTITSTDPDAGAKWVRSITSGNKQEDPTLDALTQEFRTLLTHISQYLKEQKN
jgi:hypothetical protein